MTITFKTLKTFASKFKKDESGATAIEYALMIALVGAVCITAVTTLGTNTSEQFDDVAAAIKPAD